jgi:hypothetical protein
MVATLGVAMGDRHPAAGPGLTGGALWSVAVVSPRDAWAIGSARVGHTIDTATLIEHWNGRSWKQATSPSPNPLSRPGLASVAAVSPADAWAVGTIDGQTRPLFEHWNGHSWRESLPAGPAVLEGVAAMSASDAWAVGANVIKGGGSSTLTEHWNGRAWQRVPSPPQDPATATRGLRRGRQVGR